MARCCLFLLFACLGTLLGPALPAHAEGTVPKKTELLWRCAAPDPFNTTVMYGSSPESACGGALNQTIPVEGGTETLTLTGCAGGWDQESDSPGTTCYYRRSYAYGGYTGSSGGAVNALGQRTLTCPENSSPQSGGACACGDGYKPSGDGRTCDPACKADNNTPVSSGYYDIGTEAGASPVLSGCKGGCKVYFDGTSPAGSSLVGGVKHWYAKGGYYGTGDKCTATEQSTKQVGTATPAKPADACAAGQGTATMNGKTVCVDQGGDSKTPTPDSTDKTTSKTEKTTTTNADGSTTTTETTTKTDGGGHQQTTTTTTTTGTDGRVVSNTTTTGSLPTGQGTDSSDDGPEKTECEKNPSGAGCGGQAASVGELYTPKDKTMGGVLSAARDALMGSPIGTAVGGFFVVSSAASCPTWNAHIPFIDTDLVIDQFCSQFAATALAILKTALLVVASFYAFRIAVE